MSTSRILITPALSATPDQQWTYDSAQAGKVGCYHSTLGKISSRALSVLRV